MHSEFQPKDLALRLIQQAISAKGYLHTINQCVILYLAVKSLPCCEAQSDDSAASGNASQELSFNKFRISVHPELVEGACHRTSTSSVQSGNEKIGKLFPDNSLPLVSGLSTRVQGQGISHASV
ncbi:hypothetical protein [Endozoicomonas sp. ONNA2]|uniref:hypothetical protein n=1 Tax=Endozoicomonas sp. ONNA2 TaxID=2828741 RepID=UPI002147BAE6|nr:hypothetical protein [Endozoicomonas sp. ONNA2]